MREKLFVPIRINNRLSRLAIFLVSLGFALAWLTGVSEDGVIIGVVGAIALIAFIVGTILLIVNAIK